jgi:hypothetical protein
MNETDWQGGRNIRGMLDELGDRISVRKLRLFAVACVRRVWIQVTNPQSRLALEVAERFAEGRATEEERVQAEQNALMASYDDSYFQIPALRAVVHTLAWDIRTGRPQPAPLPEGQEPDEEDAILNDEAAVGEGGARATLTALVELARLQAREGAAFPGEEIALGREAVVQEEAAQAAVLREMVGNLYRPVHLAPLWLYWNDRCVPNMARLIYDERRWADLPILADALEDAGCDSIALLDHLHGSGPHWPGCWALDLILGQA